MNKNRLKRLIAFLIFGFACPQAFAWSPNDVSVLLSLPLYSQMNEMLAPVSQGAKGELLPESIYDLFGQMEDAVVPKEIYDQNLKVIGIRIDPCFVEDALFVACRKQVRLVWQPLMESTATPKNPKPFTLDAAIHTFYEFDDTEWSILLKEWKTFSVGQETDALNVHPGISKAGFESDYWRKMRAVILRHCGKSNLVRATGMTVATVNNRRIWIFRGFDVVNSKAVPIRVARTRSMAQNFSFSLKNLDLTRFNEGKIRPVPPEDELNSVTANSEQFAAEGDLDAAKNLMISTLEFENPKRHNPGTLDCVSCHMAQSVRLWTERNFRLEPSFQEFDQARFKSSLSLNNNSVNPQDTNRMRAFGYFARDPIFSQRVINETAAVVEYLTQIAPP